MGAVSRALFSLIIDHYGLYGIEPATTPAAAVLHSGLHPGSLSQGLVRLLLFQSATDDLIAVHRGTVFWIGWATIAIFLGVLLMIDYMFLDGSAFIYEPNYAVVMQDVPVPC